VRVGTAVSIFMTKTCQTSTDVATFKRKVLDGFYLNPRLRASNEYKSLEKLICSSNRVIRVGDLFFQMSHWEIRISIVSVSDDVTSLHPGLLGYCVTPQTSSFYPRDTWPRWRFENNTIERYSYLTGMMTSPTQCTV
jgi:hypothetical protein